MPVFLLSCDSTWFPDPCLAEEDGLLAVGGELTCERMLAAYENGIFPWFNQPPILWYAPQPRFVLRPSGLHLSRSLRRTLKRGALRVTVDYAFTEVLEGCREIERPQQEGSWLTDQLCEVLQALHRRGAAHSAEAWLDGELVGGLYGLAIGTVFFGESMFARAPDASKQAFAHFTRHLLACGYTLIDCQTHSPHLERFGAEFWPFSQFLQHLKVETKVQPERPLGRREISPAGARPGIAEGPQVRQGL